MAATETISGAKGNILLNNGTTVTGNIRTITQSVGTLNPSAWDADKVANIVTAWFPLFSKAVYKVQGVKTYDITSNE